MPFYQRRGRIPAKRHTVLERDGGGMYYEELIGNEGFRGASTLLYRLHRPTRMLEATLLKRLRWEPHGDRSLRPYHLRLGRVPAVGDLCLDRLPVLYNQDIAVTVSRPRTTGEGFYRNGQGDEIVYVARGDGVLESALGDLTFGEGDYLVIPRGLVHRYRLEGDDHLFLVLESRGVVRVPARYRNDYGQFVEGAPFCERDIRVPENLRPRDETGEFLIYTKMHNALTEHRVQTHPFDVVGWDGAYYPWAFQIRNFEPVVGMIHLPPPVHQTFQGEGFVVCSFVPRPFDFHPKGVPAPYNHSNAQTDEVLFYASDEFMSRKGIEFGSLTLHPDGIPHGPHPGKAEASVGVERTDELAVMVDTFRPLHLAKPGLEYNDVDYLRSWLE